MRLPAGEMQGHCTLRQARRAVNDTEEKERPTQAKQRQIQKVPPVAHPPYTGCDVKVGGRLRVLMFAGQKDTVGNECRLVLAPLHPHDVAR
ncbi:uncharacterized protein SPSK_10097 [Sporothrix schenckii 1099-18]|uniref:Uncharacterized protein n=1 Tax=Sporothrix schenckii 1099-18 TaxID=1397361 RepID=A0A0F2M9V9_SPOSC|nr:uncharacterized protein SPSK_10097 [Sporothrix schenckii 1099-18]KJR85610.1 hypothetical protein SPSK_10097 [Sporothrix schenckii 1099-18]